MKLESKFIKELSRIEAALGKELMNEKFIKPYLGEMEILGASDEVTLICKSDQNQLFNIDIDEALEFLER